MPGPYELTTHDGKKVDWRTHAMLLEMEKDLGYPLTIVQGSYNTGVSASAGTHDGGGVVDLAPYDWDNKVRAGRKVGFAAWHRTAIPGTWGEHIHAVDLGNTRASAGAKSQMDDYRDHRDGLAGNGYDDFPYHPVVVFDYEKWQRIQSGDKAYPKIDAARKLLREARETQNESGQAAIDAALKVLNDRF